MKYECGMIEDLLPLYKDNACSESSKNAVEEHLKECPACKEILDKLKDETVEQIINIEKEDVIGSQSRFFKRKSAMVGRVIAAVFALPILICLIVNLATGHGLTWFFIVMASMLIPTSLFVVPLIVPENKMLYTMCSFTVSVILLLAVCCIYSHGSWFFIAASSVLFGLTVCFAPFIAFRRPVNSYLKNTKGLAIMGAYTLTFFMMMLCIGLTVRTWAYFKLAFGISVPLVMVAWIIFLTIRYLPVNGLAKAGICITLIGITGWASTELATYFTLRSASDADVVVTSQPSIAGAVVCIAIGLILAVIGLATGKIGGKNSESI